MKEGFKTYLTPNNIIKIMVVVIVCSIVYSLYNNTYDHKVDDFRKEKDHYFRTSIHSPIEDKLSFKGLTYFPVDERYRVVGKVEFIPGDSVINMMSSDGRNLPYIKYCHVYFTIDSIPHTLTLYKQSDSTQNQMLFLPFTDNTSGEESYISGRYLDLPYPKDGFIEIDFNKAYHPYCVYSYRFSCPVPPQENYLNIHLKAGERLDPSTTN